MQYYPTGKFLLTVPPDHKLRVYQNDFVLYDRSTSDLIQVVCGAYPTRPVLDVGANVGDTAAFLRTYCDNEIICIEGSSHYWPYLEHNAKKFGACRLLKKFIRPRRLLERGLVYEARDGSGHLSITDGSGHQGLDNTSFASLDDIRAVAEASGGSPILFKTDTDGLDAFIISEALESFDSVFSFECDPFNLDPEWGLTWPSVFQQLSDRKCKCIVFDNFGLPICCLSEGIYEPLCDMLGYLHLQRYVGSIKIYYFDIWAFPEKYHSLYDECCRRLRAGLLKGSFSLA